LLLTLERRLTNKSFEEPLFELYDEELDFDLFLLKVQGSEDSEKPKES
jgi:hypothetical protein